jgi:hypothetical protein
MQKFFLNRISLALFFGVASTSAIAAAEGKQAVYGHAGYFYGLSEADGGARSEDSTIIGSAGLRSPLWQPWFGSIDSSLSFSSSTTQNENVSNEAEIVSGNAKLALFPISRFPFSLSYNRTDREYDWTNRHTREDHFFRNTRTQSVTVRQSLIHNSGMRLDGWYNLSMRDYNDFDAARTDYDVEDATRGLKLKSRGRNYNFFASYSDQEQDNSDVETSSSSRSVAATHNYFPTQTFYIKTLASQSSYKIEDESDYGDFAFNMKSETTSDQATSMFFWRPEYKPYTMTGAARLNRRNISFDDSSARQNGFSANLAANYQLNRKTRLTATANVSSLDTESSNSLAANQGLMAYYQSDRAIYGEMTHYWYTDAGVQNEVVAEYEKTDSAQSLNANLGHAISRKWNTGNRSTLRMSGQQAVKNNIKVGRVKDESLALVHTASAALSKSHASGSSYAQLTAIDSHDLVEEVNSQVANLQMSRNSSISRLSSWGGNISGQMSRRDAGNGSNISLTTTSTAQINYQHSRLFGIYRLKFRTELEGTSISNRTGADRLQADWEARISYSVGKLNTALFLRALESDSGVGNRMGVVQINRRF